jgi:hypothetical protein
MGMHVDEGAFERMSVWADLVPHQPGSDYKWSQNLHFTSKGQSLRSFEVTHDPDCLLSAITHFAAVLLDKEDVSLSHPVTKADALKFLVHFVGDLHAPFHIGDEVDLNGSYIEVFDPVRCLLKGNCGSHKRPSLHNVWDAHILRLAEAQSGKSLYDMVADYIISSANSRMSTRRLRSGRPESVAQLALRSAKYSRNIMTGIGLHDERGRRIESGTYLTEEYFKEACPVALHTLQIAGHNLAFLLNKISDVANGRDDEFVLI